MNSIDSVSRVSMNLAAAIEWKCSSIYSDKEKLRELGFWTKYFLTWSSLWSLSCGYWKLTWVWLEYLPCPQIQHCHLVSADTCWGSLRSCVMNISSIVLIIKSCFTFVNVADCQTCGDWWTQHFCSEPFLWPSRVGAPADHIVYCDHCGLMMLTGIWSKRKS